VGGWANKKLKKGEEVRLGTGNGKLYQVC
jgi:hypothetical protein